MVIPRSGTVEAISMLAETIALIKVSIPPDIRVMRYTSVLKYGGLLELTLAYQIEEFYGHSL